MDWTELANRFADGQKLYRAFQDGAEAAAMLSNLERARNELQAQYDALTPQIAQAREELAMIRANGEAARAAAALAAEAQRKDLAAAYQTQRAALQAEADAWVPKLTALKEQFQATLAAQQTALALLEGKIETAKQQVVSLEAIKETLKQSLTSQLESVS